MWYETNKTLPPDGVAVLALTKYDKNPLIVYWQESRGAFHCPEPDTNMLKDTEQEFTHWQYLPAWPDGTVNYDPF